MIYPYLETNANQTILDLLIHAIHGPNNRIANTSYYQYDARKYNIHYVSIKRQMK